MKDMDSVKKSVAKIFCASKIYDFKTPWSNPNIKNYTGSGFVVNIGDKKYIVTNAHVVENFAYSEIRLANNVQRYEIKPKIIDHNCDLAFCEVVEKYEEFDKKTKAVELGELANNFDSVIVVGFPKGGDKVCFTKGIVSRTERDDYVHRGITFLSQQVDAAINSGNSGGPVFNKDGKVAGVAFQGLSKGQNIGYIIPATILKHFIKECTKTILDDKYIYQGFPNLAIYTRKLTNEALRNYYGLKKQQTGVLVTDVDKLSSSRGILLEKDIILKVDGKKVHNDGSVKLDNGSRVNFRNLFNSKFVNDKIKISVLRNGKEKDIEIPLKNVSRATKAVPYIIYDTSPDYIIASGMICLQRATENLGCNPHSGKYSKSKSESTDEIVIISKILKCKETRGYEDMNKSIVTEINGKKIKNFKDALDAIKNHKGKQHKIMTSSDEIVIISNLGFKARSKLLKERFGIYKYYKFKEKSQSTMNGMYICPLLKSKKISGKRKRLEDKNKTKDEKPSKKSKNKS